jgi:hypothetical protein
VNIKTTMRRVRAITGWPRDSVRDDAFVNVCEHGHVHHESAAGYERVLGTLTQEQYSAIYKEQLN